MSAESPLFSQTYDLLRWLLPVVATMPREQRSSLARRISEVAFTFQHLLIAATKHPSDTASLLRKADTSLAELRLLLRLARDLRAISFKQYEEGARRSSEIGRLLGGWLRHTDQLSPVT